MVKPKNKAAVIGWVLSILAFDLGVGLTSVYFYCRNQPQIVPDEDFDNLPPFRYFPDSTKLTGRIIVVLPEQLRSFAPFYECLARIDEEVSGCQIVVIPGRDVP